MLFAKKTQSLEAFKNIGLYGVSTLLIFTGTMSSLAGCVSKPPEVKTIPSTANPISEIEQTKKILEEAHANQVNVLSPTNFTKAQKALDAAIALNVKNESNEKILAQISMARAWISEANERAKIATLEIKDVIDARRGSIMAKAPEMFPKEWAHAEQDLTKVTKSIEQGKINPAEKKAGEIISQYNKLETDATAEKFLGKALDNISLAEKLDAKKIAPKSLSIANEKYNEALSKIKKDPRNFSSIKSAALESNRASQHLVEVTQKIREGNTEDLILQSETQQQTISHLRKENRSAEEELAELEQKQMELIRTQDLLNKAALMRSQLNPQEAEVFTENGKIVVRLKALRFPNNGTTLGKKSEGLLKKVNQALLKTNPSRVLIEGHTDSVGTEIQNQSLSAARAKSVQDYLVSSGAVNFKSVESVGRGSAEPLGENTTPAGRSMNRRVDLIIEPVLRQ